MERKPFIDLLNNNKYNNIDIVTENGITVCSFTYDLIVDTDKNLILLYSSKEINCSHRIEINFSIIKRIRTWEKESIIELTI